jgi:hypothetical protein
VLPTLPCVGCGAEIGTEFEKQAEAAAQTEVNKNLLPDRKGGQRGKRIMRNRSKKIRTA